jgi:regulator of protease activity HflC (stomatin/prohibitin superfamily)
MVTQSTHFANARRFIPVLAIAGFGFALTGLTLAVVASTRVLGLESTIDLGVLGLIGASLLIAASGFLASALICEGRHRVVVAQERESGASASGQNKWLGLLKGVEPSSLPSESDEASKRLARVSGWPQIVLIASLAFMSGAFVLLVWPKQPLRGDSETLLLFSAMTFAAAFPLLVLERLYANTTPAALPEAESLARLLRVPLLALVGGGISIAAAAAGFGWSLWIEQIIGVVILLSAAELLGRAVAAAYLPAPGIEAVRALADSSCAAWIRLEIPNLRGLNAMARSQFGIDLSRSWALLFVRRATLPVAAGLAVMGWLLTAVTILTFDERGIYERMGVPVEVLPPGLHIRLPWPFGSVRRLEYGVIHEMVIAPIQSDVEEARKEAGVEPPAKAESDPPASADRLWDVPHPSEVTYLIASADNGKQGFQIVDIDIRLLYRIGLLNTSALNVVYQVGAPEALVRAAASRLLARYFASHTLSGVFRDNRAMVAEDIRSALQRQLNELSSGIEILQVVIEAIHPPPGAAPAYHSVQAAEIGARTTIAKAQGNAIRAAKLANRETISAIDGAQAQVAENVEGAKHDAQLFQADARAEQTFGRAFLFERWLDRLSHGLSKVRIVILDHRFTGLDAPTIDLRTFAPPITKPRDQERGKLE